MTIYAVKLTHISKKYILHHEKPTFAESILTRRKDEEFWALSKINLAIKKGERVGIIGPNGSGKTTLLEIIAGITKPTRGAVKVDGRLTSLIELEAGFHPDLTGEENIHLNGLLVGMSKGEIKKKLDKIIAFADIKQFIDSPFYTYSEGMKLRLGFSIIAHTDPDILLLDENMAVGDKVFKKKSSRKISEFFKAGKTIIIVSHIMSYLKENCERAIWLDQGKVIKDGEAKTVIKHYQKENGNQNK